MAMMRQSDDAMAMKRFSIVSSSLLYRVSAPSRYIDLFALALFAQEGDSVMIRASWMFPMPSTSIY